MSKATIPSYKWWETNDKTKRLYTELLAEKLSSPRKSGGSSTYKPSTSGMQNHDAGKSSPNNGSHKHDGKGAPIQGRLTSKDREGATSLQSIEKEETLERKYTFETITIDTLAKYDYIKSPTKKPDSGLSRLPETKQNVNSLTDLSKPPAKNTGKQAACSGMNGKFLLSKKLSTPAKKEVLPCGSKENLGHDNVTAKPKVDTSGVKMVEAPGISGRSEAAKSSEDQRESIVSLWDRKVSSFDKKSCGRENAHEEKVDIEDLTEKYQTLCDEVEKLEMKLSEFSDDFKKVTEGMGFKDAKDEALDAGKNTRSPRKPHFSSFKDKYSFTPVWDSPSSSTKPFRSLLYKNLAGPALKSKEELDAEIRKIKERQLTEDEIQEVLRCAKAKYVDNPNYLKDLGYETRPEARLNG